MKRYLLYTNKLFPIVLDNYKNSFDTINEGLLYLKEIYYDSYYIIDRSKSIVVKRGVR